MSQPYTQPRANLHDEAEEADHHPIKPADQKLYEDLVYTLNHAVVCGTLDVVNPPLGNWTQKKLPAFGRWSETNIPVIGGWIHRHLPERITIGPQHGHDAHDDHHHHHDHDHGTHDHHDHHAGHGHTLWHWVIGEGVGDVGAVPFTLGMQYYAPSVMRGIQNLAEPIFGPAFWWSAQRSARNWAHKNGIAPDDNAVHERAEDIYRHEVEHLPHAAIWTASSLGINVATQKLVGNRGSVSEILIGKAAGTLFTLGSVLGMRTLSPGTVQDIDHFNSEYIAKPTTRFVSGLLGIDSGAVERVLAREEKMRDARSHQDEQEKKPKHKEKKHDKPISSVFAPVREHLVEPKSSLAVTPE